MRTPPTPAERELGSLQVAAVIPDAMPRSSGDTSPITSDCVSGFDRFIRNTLTAYSPAAIGKIVAEGMSTMNTVDAACVVTTAFTMPSLRASFGDMKTTPAVRMLVSPSAGPLTVSETMYILPNHRVMRGTKSPAPTAIATL